MLKKIPWNLTSKISLAVILIESLGLALIGGYYSGRFYQELDHNMAIRVRIPGILMAQGVLSFEAINNQAMMEELVGEPLQQGWVIGVNQRVFYALRPDDAGKPVADIPEIVFADRLRETIEQHENIPTPDGLINITPLRAQGKKLIGFLYLKLSNERLIARKRSVAFTFVLGSILCLALTSIALILLLKSMIIKKIGEVVKCLKRLEQGDLTMTTQRVYAADEIGTLAHGLQAVIASLQSKAQIADHISKGDLRYTTPPQSEHDMLGHAFQRMAAYLSEMASVATALADGDLRLEVQPKTAEDVLGNAFDRLKSLRALIGQVIESAECLEKSSQRLSLVNFQMVAGAEKTAQQVQVVSSNSQQITQNVDHVSSAAIELAASSQHITQDIKTVTEAIMKAVNSATTANMTITELATHSQEIGDIIQVITYIARQTNLLALNATIEAARAGETGRGFAVVAGEVKNLANETTHSAEEVTHKIEAIQKSSQQASEAISHVTEIIRQVAELATGILTAISEQTDTTRHISEAVTIAAHGSREISHAISEVAAAAQEASDRAVNVQEAAQESATLATQLQNVVSTFRI